MTEFTIGGVHEYTDGADEGRAVGADGFLPLAESWVEFVLKRAGIDNVPGTRAGLIEIARRFPCDSIEALAIGMADKLIGIQVSRLAMRSRGLPDAVIDELIWLSAELGMNYSVLTSVERGVSAAAMFGIRSEAQRSEAALQAASARRLAVMRGYGDFVLKVAAELRSLDPDIKKAEIIREVRKRWTRPPENRPGIAMLPSTDKALNSFLSNEGF